MSDMPSPQRQSGGRRQVVKHSFYRVDPQWRGRPDTERDRGKQEFCSAVEAFAGRLQIRSYSVVGMRADADILLWQIGENLEDIQALASAINGTAMGSYLSMSYSYLAMTRRSVYTSREEASERLALQPTNSKYFFVYPFVKTREWYQLSQEERQRMMDEHIRIGRKYPSVKLNTTYSFGLDDQEFVVSFETDEPADFLDLVMELREAKTSLYTLRDTPIFTCVAMSLREALGMLDGNTNVTNQARETSVNGVGWTPVTSLEELTDGGTMVVYAGGEQVALFNVGGEIYAVENRCSHANGQLAEGPREATTVTCPHHGSKFDLRTGLPLCGPASRPLARFGVRVDDGQVLIAPSVDRPGGPPETAV